MHADQSLTYLHVPSNTPPTPHPIRLIIFFPDKHYSHHLFLRLKTRAPLESEPKSPFYGYKHCQLKS